MTRIWPNTFPYVSTYLSGGRITLLWPFCWECAKKPDGFQWISIVLPFPSTWWFPFVDHKYLNSVRKKNPAEHYSLAAGISQEKHRYNILNILYVSLKEFDIIIWHVEMFLLCKKHCNLAFGAFKQTSWHVPYSMEHLRCLCYKQSATICWNKKELLHSLCFRACCLSLLQLNCINIIFNTTLGLFMIRT